jgi:hypothetical protein
VAARSRLLARSKPAFMISVASGVRAPQVHSVCCSDSLDRATVASCALAPSGKANVTPGCPGRRVKSADVTQGVELTRTE